MPDIKTGTFQISGLSDLEQQLMAFPDAVKRTILGSSLASGCRVIQSDAKNRCPQSAEQHYLGKGSKRVLIQPGDLRKKGIRVRRVREQVSGRLTYCVYVSKTYWYWKFVEFGHVIANKKRTRAEKRISAENWKGGYVSPKPFMRPAFDSQKEAAVAIVADYLRARIHVASEGGKWKSMKNYLKMAGA